MKLTSPRWTARSLRHSKGFGLIELLVVVAILVVLLSLSIPALEMGRRLVQNSVCFSNMRQLYLGLHGYALENNGFLPLSLQPDPDSSSGALISWQILIGRQLNVPFPKPASKSVFICPSWKVTYPVPAYRTYALNLSGGSPTTSPPRLFTLSALSQTALVLECKHETGGAGYSALSGSITGVGGKGRLDVRHDGKMNILTADGAVIALTPTDPSIDDLLNNIRK